MIEAAPGRLRIRLLGPVAVQIGDRPIAIGGPRVRALLTSLVLARGRMLSADALMSDVWGQATPGIRSALRANVSRLRATELGPHLVGGRQGYAVMPHPMLDVDLWRVADAVETSAAPPAELMAELAATLESVLLEGTGSSPFIPRARARARALVRRAAMRAVESHPRHPLALPVAERLLALEPADPELRALLLATRGRFVHGPFAAVAGPGDAAPAAPTRRVGVPAPIAAYQARPEDESRLAAALRLSRLVSLVGPPGVGKSRLAIEWARGPASASQEHVWFCRPGQGVRPPLEPVARAVGAQESTLAAVTSRLEHARGTIVLDGFDSDTAVPAADWAALLEGAPGVSLLVTSHRPLGVPGESVLRLEALSVPDARALFLLRAPALLTGPDGATASIDVLVSGLGRLPLAIELAAARAAHVPLASVLDALSTDGGRADLLHAAVTATLALLAEADRRRLSELCVFRGPFTVDSAVAVVGADVPPVLDTLRGWALLSDESRPGVARYGIPAVVRRHVAAVEEPPAVRARHTEWFTARAGAAFDELTTHAAAAAWQRLDADGADIDAVRERALAAGDRDSALRIAAGMSWFGLLSGAQSAALTLARRAAQVPGVAPAAIEARAGLGRGILAYQLGSLPEARAALDHARTHAATAGDPDLMALADAYLAYLATLRPQGTRDAVAAIRTARRHLPTTSVSTQAMVALVSAQVDRTVGEHVRALRSTHTARVLAQRAGHGWVSLMARVVAAKVLIDARAPERALAELHAALADARVAADPISVLIATSVAAGAAASAGFDAAAARIVGAVDAIGPRYGFDPRANEPGDFERYRRRAREGLTDAQWRDAHTSGAALTLAELIEETMRLPARGAARR